MSYDFFPMLIAGITLGFSAGISPGPLMALTISETLKSGTRAGLFVAFVPLITDLPIIVGSIFIVSKLQNINLLLIVISVIGALYLFYLGYENIKIKHVVMSEFKTNNSSFKKGVITNYTNPNPYIFWITIGGPILIASFNYSLINSITFLFTFYFFLVGVKVIIVFIGTRFKVFFGSTKYIFIIKFMGLLLILFGMILLYDAIVLINL
jgi:threonine/homoserine/homoserine lactone efflux protein